MSTNNSVKYEIINLEPLRKIVQKKGGNIFSTTSTLIRFLGIEPSKNKDIKDAQEKYISEYIRYESTGDGYKVVVTAISNCKTPKPRIVGSGNRKVEVEYLVDLIENYIAKCNSENIITTRNNIALSTGIISTKFKDYLGNRKTAKFILMSARIKLLIL